MPKELYLNAPRDLQLRQYQEHSVSLDEIRAEAIISGISHGTEMNLYTGNNPFVDKTFDPDLRMFVPQTKDAPQVTLGYEWVGRVTEIGERVTRFKVGDLVHLTFPHRETHTFKEDRDTMRGKLRPMPNGLEPETAVVLALASVALQAVHDAHIKLGDRVAVFGMGVIGLLAVQLARMNGATWVAAVDPIKKRRELAESFGADLTLDPTSEDVAYTMKSTGKAPDIAIELSGNYNALNDAIRSVAMGGTVVAGGFYRGGGTPLQLGAEWHHNRVTLLSSMGVWGCPHRDHPTWNIERVHHTSAELLAAGKLKTDNLITHRVPYVEANRAYHLIEEKPDEVVKVVLTYN